MAALRPVKPDGFGFHWSKISAPPPEAEMGPDRREATPLIASDFPLTPEDICDRKEKQVATYFYIKEHQKGFEICKDNELKFCVFLRTR